MKMNKIIIETHNGVILRVVVTEATLIQTLDKKKVENMDVKFLVKHATEKMDEKIIERGLYGI